MQVLRRYRTTKRDRRDREELMAYVAGRGRARSKVTGIQVTESQS